MAARSAASGPLQREQVAVILARALRLAGKGSLSRFTDWRKVDPFARSAVAALVAKGWLKGRDGYLNPRGMITRAQAATLLERALAIPGNSDGLPYADASKIPVFARRAVAILTADGVLESGSRFRPNAPEQRAAFAAMLVRAEAVGIPIAGVPNLVSGQVARWIAPDDPSLAVSSSLAGTAGGLTLASGRLIPLAPKADVFANGTPSDVYALNPGDRVVGILGSQGRLKVVVDLTPAPTASAGVADASSTALYLTNGSALKVTGEVAVRLGTRTATLPPGNLVGATVALPVPSGMGTLSLLDIEIPGVTAEVQSVSASGFEADVSGGGEGLLPSGPLSITTHSSTAFQDGGQSVETPPPPGTIVTLILRLSASGTAQAVTVVW